MTTLLERLPQLPLSLSLSAAEKDEARRALVDICGHALADDGDDDEVEGEEALVSEADAPAADAEAIDDEPRVDVISHDAANTDVSDAMAALVAAEAAANSAEAAADKVLGLEQTSSAATAAAAAAAEQEVAEEEAALLDSAGASALTQTPWAEVDESDVSDFAARVPRPAIAYPFELDDFQKRAVLRLERNEDVFVCAHTSAGKTVVAEYAVALALRHCTRAIYTSPVKALSNQKFRELRASFGEDAVGLLTGDASINPKAACLIMTTEILRGMIHRQSPLVDEVEWIIFDEVHYINDVERGVVWEETIISLPPSCRVVCLSATVPNHLECANWIGATKQRRVHVISTDRRPTPLRHNLYAAESLWLLVDEDRVFQHASYAEAARAHRNLANVQKVGKGGGGKGGGGKGGGGKGGGGKGGGAKGGGRGGKGGARGGGKGRGGRGQGSNVYAKVVLQPVGVGGKGNANNADAPNNVSLTTVLHICTVYEETSELKWTCGAVQRGLRCTWDGRQTVRAQCISKANECAITRQEALWLFERIRAACPQTAELIPENALDLSVFSDVRCPPPPKGTVAIAYDLEDERGAIGPCVVLHPHKANDTFSWGVQYKDACVPTPPHHHTRLPRLGVASRRPRHASDVRLHLHRPRQVLHDLHRLLPQRRARRRVGVQARHRQRAVRRLREP